LNPKQLAYLFANGIIGQEGAAGGTTHSSAPKEDMSSKTPAHDKFLEHLEQRDENATHAENEIGSALTRSDLHRHAVEHGGKIVGAVAYRVHKPGHASIEHMGSTAKGVGSSLLNRLKQEHEHLTTSNTVESARGFYEKHGFRPGSSSDEMVWKRDS